MLKQREGTHQEIKGISTSINWCNSHLIPLSRGFIFRVRGSLSAFRNARSPDSGPLSSWLLCLSSQASLPFSLTCSEISSHKAGQRMIKTPANYQALRGQWPSARPQSTNCPSDYSFTAGADTTQQAQTRSMSEQLWTRTQGPGELRVWLLSLCIGCFLPLKLISCISPFSCLFYL